MQNIPNAHLDVFIDFLVFYKNSIVLNSLKEGRTLEKIIFRDGCIMTTMHIEEALKKYKKRTEYDDKITGKIEGIQ